MNQNSFPLEKRPKIQGGARKFGLGKKPKPMLIAKSTDDGEVQIDTDRPHYEEALLAIQPDLVIGDVFCLDLSLPIRLKREGKLKLGGGIYYRHRDYTPSKMVDLVAGKNSLVPEVT